MTDQVVDQQVENQVQNAPEPSPVELEARNQGWVPKEEFTGDEKQWIDADEFVRRKPLFEKIDRQNRELKEVKKALDQLTAHHAKVKEVEYERALAALKAQKAAAFEEGDAAKIVEIDEQIADTKEEQKAFKAEATRQAQAEARAIHPEFEAWTKRNSWYTADPIMKAAADAIGIQLAQAATAKGEAPDREAILKGVETKIKAEFPHKFRNPNREKPGAVESASPKGTKSDTDYSPSDFERQVAKRFVRQGVFKTEAEYYKQLKDMNGKS
jgi:hypothetical protein